MIEFSINAITWTTTSLSVLYFFNLIYYRIKKVELIHESTSNIHLAIIVVLELVKIPLIQPLNIYQSAMIFMMIATLVYLLYRKHRKQCNTDKHNKK
ncbi:hypothetical protein ACE193_21555 [Bernardetia sp. OM2101]|uniref:hypothetical protein n=1 Tax=Bernardetia sp. OM2101 TaxID=3344876 RepID=UPI0035CFBAFD